MNDLPEDYRRQSEMIQSHVVQRNDGGQCGRMDI